MYRVHQCSVSSSLVVCLVLLGFCFGCTKSEPSSSAPVSGASLMKESNQKDPAAPADPAVPPADPATWVAKVNGREIIEADVAREARAFAAQRMGDPNAQLPADMQAQFRQAATQMLINQNLLMAEAESRGIKTTDEEVEAKVQEIKQSVPSAEGEPDIWERFGMKESEFRQSVAVMVQLDQLRDVLTAEVTDVTPGQVQEYYDEHLEEFEEQDQVRASHILLAFSESDTDEQKKEKREKIESLLDQVKNQGGDFAELAAEHSDCPSGKSAGGDLDFFTKERMVPPFAEAAFALPVGEISDVVETQFGYHIIRVTDRREARTVPFEEAKDGIEEGLNQMTSGHAMENLLTKLRESAKIDYNPESGVEPLDEMMQ